MQYRTFSLQKLQITQYTNIPQKIICPTLMQFQYAMPCNKNY